MTDWQNKRILVIGLGSTGVSMLSFFTHMGVRVDGYDENLSRDKQNELQTRFENALVLTGLLQTVLSMHDYDILALSPGVSSRLQPIADFQAAGGTVLGDVEILAQLLAQQRADGKNKILAITGANGKTTTTSLVGFLCERCGLDTVVAGNIGTPVLDAYLARQGKPADVWVLELSSFQLDTTHCLDAAVAAVLNISEDHLDRYDDLLDYAHAKDRIFRGKNVIQVLNADDVFCRAMKRRGSEVKWFSLQKPADYWLNNGVLSAGDEPLMAQSALPLQGKHNAANVLVALAMCEAVGLPRTELLRHVRDFRGLPHRVEKVAELDGVIYIDDSKGTNVGATCAALQGLDKPIVLLAGGQGKAQDFTPLQAALHGKARAVLLIGVDARQIGDVLAGASYPVEYFATLEDATRRAHELAHKGDIVLLSPACASYDMFRGYAHRSQVFIDTVREIQAAL